MGWRRPELSEVIRTSYNSATEVKLPDSVDCHSGCEQVVLAGYPLSEVPVFGLMISRLASVR